MVSEKAGIDFRPFFMVVKKVVKIGMGLGRVWTLPSGVLGRSPKVLVLTLKVFGVMVFLLAKNREGPKATRPFVRLS